ncbi:biotin--[acetyl-CoA-carboxylase] ligase [Dysgonomonas sp. Marseille-P4677]|uniref:biotin--[acetyl-CoA-carboxylase] ligase n=1 Tax=Dysgonomonas sp. Marseille-P4677 TaxID=2364790 RepID=UPI0019138B8D|nr:biotin--[acetyl-CoA-carboxylase] ligase [Dysgonomonas sp. Marseille-P4677]MBK5720235.1 biotin--[acetyl-CoA-carboxylase] ligase [Dysgonomonas sp. Marseille-P4677]
MPPIIHLIETDSTNNYIKNLLVEETIEEGTIVYTNFQTAGKGQRGNSWESEKEKNLSFSIVLYPKRIKANEQFILSQIVSLAIADYIRFRIDNIHIDDITIKWPNDIYWQDKKLCGILIESTLINDKIDVSVIGIGININQTEFRSNAPNPISLKQITGQNYDIQYLIQDIQDYILDYYTRLQQHRAELALQYKNILFRNNGYHLYNDGKANFTARIKDIKPSGILVLETKDGEERCFAFKEVKYILS